MMYSEGDIKDFLKQKWNSFTPSSNLLSNKNFAKDNVFLIDETNWTFKNNSVNFIPNSLSRLSPITTLKKKPLKAVRRSLTLLPKSSTVTTYSSETPTVQDKIVFLDIQTVESHVGDCIILQSSNENGEPIYAMIDTGKFSKVSYVKILNYLNYHNIKQLEWLLLTHFHNDHIGGLSHILQNKTIIKSIYTKKYNNLDSYDIKDCPTVEKYRENRLKDWNNMINEINSYNIPIHYVAKNQNHKFSLGNYHFTLFNVEEAFTDFKDECTALKACNENTNSLVAVCRNDKRFYYFSGDIDTYPAAFKESNDERLKKAYFSHRVDQWIIKTKKKFNIDHYDFYKISHHGTLYNNIKETFLEGKPKIAVVTTARDSLGERAEKLETRIKCGCPTAKIFYSGHGMVIITQHKNGIITYHQGNDANDDNDNNDKFN